MANNKDITGRTGKGGGKPSQPNKIVTSSPRGGGTSGSTPNGSYSTSPEGVPNKVFTSGPKAAPKAKGASKTPSTNMKAMGRGC